jgi:hypothetical protein
VARPSATSRNFWASVDGSFQFSARDKGLAVSEYQIPGDCRFGPRLIPAKLLLLFDIAKAPQKFRDLRVRIMASADTFNWMPEGVPHSQTRTVGGILLV